MLSHFAGESVNTYPILETVWHYLLKLKYTYLMTQQQIISFLGMRNAYVHQETYTKMFTALFFIVSPKIK